MEWYIVQLRAASQFLKDYESTNESTNNVENVHELGNTLTSILHRYNNINLCNTQKYTIFNQEKKRLYLVAQGLRKIQREHPNFRVRINNQRPNYLIHNVLEHVFMYQTLTQRLLEFINTVFTEFIKGITYFQQNTGVERPVYHRDISCGTRNPHDNRNRIALDELTCEGHYDNLVEFDRRSTKSRNCAIERIIYDRLFSKYFSTGEQDYGHRLHGLRIEREEYFNKCFPSTVLDIDVSFNEDDIPIALTINQSNASRIAIERYVKSCKRYNANILRTSRVQTLNPRAAENLYKVSVEGYRMVYNRTDQVKIYNTKRQTFRTPVLGWKTANVSHLTENNTFRNTVAIRQLNRHISENV